MIITCPECATRYQADAAKFPAAGRKVKCAKCGHAWHQDPPAAEAVVDIEEPIVRPEPPAPPPPPPPPPPVVSQPVVEAPRVSAFAPEPAYVPPAPVAAAVLDAPRRPSVWPGRLGVMVGWGLLVAILLIAGWGAVHYRQTVATLWPQTASLYKMFGMPVNALGIDFQNVSYKREKQDGQSVLAITGRLVNISGRELPVPQIRAALNDDQERELYHWTFSSGVVTMKPGQVAKFVTRISSPPPGAKHLKLRFSKDGE